jgi:hypothetical protein
MVSGKTIIKGFPLLTKLFPDTKITSGFYREFVILRERLAAV